MFASAGEKLTDFDVFHPDRMASRILDMGDMLTLIEQAEKTFDQEQAAKAAGKLTGQGGEFTLDDFLEQMQQVRKLGSMSKIMGMLPGMGQFRDQLENFDEREIDRIQAIIQSMTPAERANPKMIDGSRRARIARGSGRQVSDVNSLVDRFFEARKMMHVSSPRAAGCPACRGCPAWPAAASAARPSRPRSQAGQGPPGLAATRPRPRQQARAATGEGRRAGQPVRQPRRRGDRLREGRGRPRPAQGLLQVPQVGRVSVIVVDGANVVGARPDGWWKDRAGAARRLHEQLMTADRRRRRSCSCSRVRRRRVCRSAATATSTVVHAPRDGDSEIVRQAHHAADAGRTVTVVTADRLLAARVAKAGSIVGPTWLLDRLV